MMKKKEWITLTFVKKSLRFSKGRVTNNAFCRRRDMFLLVKKLLEYQSQISSTRKTKEVPREQPNDFLDTCKTRDHRRTKEPENHKSNDDDRLGDEGSESLKSDSDDRIYNNMYNHISNTMLSMKQTQMSMKRRKTEYWHSVDTFSCSSPFSEVKCILSFRSHH